MSKGCNSQPSPLCLTLVGTAHSRDCQSRKHACIQRHVHVSSRIARPPHIRLRGHIPRGTPEKKTSKKRYPQRAPAARPGPHGRQKLGVCWRDKGLGQLLGAQVHPHPACDRMVRAGGRPGRLQPPARRTNADLPPPALRYPRAGVADALRPVPCEQAAHAVGRSVKPRGAMSLA